MPTSSVNGEDAILFSVMDRAARIYSYSWLIEWTTSSLCIKPTYKPLQLMKVSIHGADPKHIDKQHFRLDFDHEQPATKAANAGGAWTEDGAELPQYFDDQQVTKRAKHIVRFAVGAEMFAAGIPSAPVPKIKIYAALSAPTPGKVPIWICFSPLSAHIGRKKRRSNRTMRAWGRSPTSRACI
jgi:hypothetical protein